MEWRIEELLLAVASNKDWDYYGVIPIKLVSTAARYKPSVVAWIFSDNQCKTPI